MTSAILVPLNIQVFQASFYMVMTVEKSNTSLLKVRFSFWQSLHLCNACFRVFLCKCKLCCSTNWKKSLNYYLYFLICCMSQMVYMMYQCCINYKHSFKTSWRKKRDSNMLETIVEHRSVNLYSDRTTLRMANIDTNYNI